MTPVTAAAVIREGLDDAPATQAETPVAKRGRAMQAITDLSRRARYVLLPMAGAGALMAAVEVMKPGSALAQSYVIPAVASADQPDQPRIILAAASAPAAPAMQQNPAIVPAAAPQAAANAPANVSIGIDISPELEQSYGISLAEAAAKIQDDVVRRRGSIINRVSVRSTPLSPAKNPDNTVDWGRIVNGLNNPSAKYYSIDVLSKEAKPGDPYSQVITILNYVANEKYPENFSWRAKYVNKDAPSVPVGPEDTAAYQTRMAQFRDDFSKALAAQPEPMRTEICRRMIEAMRAAEAAVGPMKMGAIYRFFTTRVDLLTELAIINEKLPTAAGADRTALQTRKNTIIANSLLDLSDAQVLIARLVAPQGITPAVALFADVQLPDPEGSGKSLSISHFADFAKIPAGKGMKLGTTRGYVTPDGARLLGNIPGIAAATNTVSKGFGLEVANTIENMPAQVSAVNDWGIEYYNQVIKASETDDKLRDAIGTLLNMIEQRKSFVLDKKGKDIYAEVDKLAAELRADIAKLRPGVAKFVPLMAGGKIELTKHEEYLFKGVNKLIGTFENVSKQIQAANRDIVASRV